MILYSYCRYFIPYYFIFLSRVLSLTKGSVPGSSAATVGAAWLAVSLADGPSLVSGDMLTGPHGRRRTNSL